MSLNPYLNFNGNCREAVNFYHNIFITDAPSIMTYADGHGDDKETLPEGASDLIMHTSLIIHGVVLMFSDVPPGMPFVLGNNFNLTIVSKDMDEIRSLFEKLKEDGSVIMELQETFWSKLYASVVDKFGICWQLSHEE